jgi:integrase/recombinase XerD
MYFDEYRPNYWLFEGQDDGNYSGRGIQNVLKANIRILNVAKTITVLTLRQCFAKNLMLHSVDFMKVQEYLVHSKLETT